MHLDLDRQAHKLLKLLNKSTLKVGSYVVLRDDIENIVTLQSVYKVTGTFSAYFVAGAMTLQYHYIDQVVTKAQNPEYFL